MSTELPLPVLEEYFVSASNAFLPDEFPVKELQDGYYRPWETIANNLPSLLLARQLRPVVEKLKVLEVKKGLLEDVGQLRRAYSVLGFIAHAYVWGYDDACDTLPDSVAKPLLEVSGALGLPPLATYAGLVLWNFCPIFEDAALVEGGSLWDLSNLRTINTFTGSMDESWFYLISVFFEKCGARSMNDGLGAIRAVRTGDRAGVIAHLQALAEGIDSLGALLGRMEEMCDPYVFYYRIRPYLAGWKNMADLGLPNGVRYGANGEYRAYVGGSNAQSSLIQMLDILLGVEHFQTGVTKSADRSISAESNGNAYISEMRNYMPEGHRLFLAHLQQVANIRDYVLSHNSDAELVLAYDACVSMMKSFRDRHIQLVTRYVVLQARKREPSTKPHATLRSGLSKNSGTMEQRGTGGTSLIPFLKQCRDETGSVAASAWGKRILYHGVLRVKDNSILDPPKKGNSVAEPPADELVNNYSDQENNLPGHW
ncbi:AaceriACR188Cp [[Ashbya] aceris (nom. inval.)]|nr:AaceriACR188Cp [[Ashbya] aceris (nom. inval.)]